MSGSTSVVFNPSPLSPFQFQATLDGALYNIIVTWNISRQGWYVTCVDQSNNVIFTIARIGSPDDYPISMSAGYFDTTLVFYETTQTFVVG